MDFRKICARMVDVMQVLEIMKTHVTTTRPEATLGEAVDLMDIYRASCLPVTDVTKCLCGILREEDVLRAITGNQTGTPEQVVERALHTKEAALLLVQDFMVQPAICVSEHCEAIQAARLIMTHDLSCLPVTDELGRVVGTLNRVDIFQAVFENLL